MTGASRDSQKGVLLGEAFGALLLPHSLEGNHIQGHLIEP